MLSQIILSLFIKFIFIFKFILSFFHWSILSNWISTPVIVQSLEDPSKRWLRFFSIEKPVCKWMDHRKNVDQLTKVLVKVKLIFNIVPIIIHLSRKTTKDTLKWQLINGSRHKDIKNRWKHGRSWNFWYFIRIKLCSFNYPNIILVEFLLYKINL